VYFHERDLPEQLNTAPSIALVTLGTLFQISLFILLPILLPLKENSSQITSKSQIHPLDNPTNTELVVLILGVVLFLQILMPNSVSSQDGDKKIDNTRDEFSRCWDFLQSSCRKADFTLPAYVCSFQVKYLIRKTTGKVIFLLCEERKAIDINL